MEASRIADNIAQKNAWAKLIKLKKLNVHVNNAIWRLIGSQANPPEMFFVAVRVQQNIIILFEC